MASALRRAVAYSREALIEQSMISIANQPTAGDLACSRSSTTRKLGLTVRAHGFFNATGWSEIGGYIDRTHPFCLMERTHSAYWTPIDWDGNEETPRQRRRDVRSHDLMRGRQRKEACRGVAFVRYGHLTRRNKLAWRERAKGRSVKQQCQLDWHTGSCSSSCDDTPVAPGLCGVEVAV